MSAAAGARSLLFTPIELRGVRARNRVVVSPMCLYTAENGFANDWHFVHYGKLAIGGAGVVFVEATALEPDGRITHGCTGLWCDEQIAPLKRIADFVRAEGAVPAIQLAHAGRKGSSQRPWQGGEALGAAEAGRGEGPWRMVARTRRDAFGAMQGSLELEYARSTGFFTWAGFEEMDEVSGSGSAELPYDGALEIAFAYHLGAGAILKAVRVPSSTAC